ncbi:MAG: helix-turn-helix domain-containing protein [Desulfobacterales bacterium]|nr:helix-turn-helix domain-containing protein [Desulfobacterales bacterium]
MGTHKKIENPDVRAGIKALIKKTGLTQKELADAIGISSPRLNNMADRTLNKLLFWSLLEIQRIHRVKGTAFVRKLEEIKKNYQNGNFLVD